MTLIISNLLDVVAIWRFLIGQSQKEPPLISNTFRLRRLSISSDGVALGARRPCGICCSPA